MPRTKGISTNRLSRSTLIKTKNSRLEDLVESGSEPLRVGANGQFLFEASRPEPPAWIRKFFGDTFGRDLRILQIPSAKALFLVPIREKIGPSILPFHLVKAVTS